jgi:hypothetical protein
MTEPLWELAHSVATSADPAFVWKYMSDVANWDDPPAEFKLWGPFVDGSKGTTVAAGQERHWQLRDVHPMSGYTVEFPLDRAALSFEWKFGPLPDGRTLLSQRVVLKGENAAVYLSEVEPAFTASLAPGMNRIAGAIERAATNRATA